MRLPAVAGSFYDGDKKSLLSGITKFSKDSKRNKERIKAMIVPHAGYYFSGKCAMKAYNYVIGTRFLIVGPNHYGYSSGLSEQDWQTPLGIARSDKVLLEEIKKIIGINEDAHKKEHSIEVQLPLIQSKIKKFTFCPLSLGTDVEPYVLGKKLRFILEKEDITLIISSDFTHYGPNFGYIPFKENIKENLKKLDMKSIEYLLKFDFNGFKAHLEKTGTTICGYMGLLVLLSIFEGTDYKTELVDYYTSGDVMNDFRNSVSYASIIIKK